MLVRTYFFFLFLLAASPLAAQAVQTVYQQFTEQDGLPSNYLNCLFQDSKGFIWMGTDKGLTRFDGLNFKTYTTDDGLSGNMILTITEDEQGQLWIGTFERGLCRFDRTGFECWGQNEGIKTVAKISKLGREALFYSEGAGKLARFDLKKQQPEILIDLPIPGFDNSLITLSGDRILFPCGNKIFLISEEGIKEEVFFEKRSSSFFVKKGLAGHDGKAWLLDSQNGQLLLVELMGKALVVRDSLPGLKTNANLYEGNDFLIANYTKGNTYLFIDKESKSADLKANPHVGQNEDVLIDAEGQVWLATLGYGLFVQKGYPYLHQLPAQNEAAYDLEILPHGDLLVGGDKGVWWYDKALKLQTYQPKIEQVRGVKFLPEIGFCAGTLQGETYFFENATALLHPALKPGTIVSSGFSGVMSLQNGEVIFSSYGAGLQLFSNGKTKKYDLDQLPNLMVEGLFETSHGLWATSSSDGVLLINKKKNRLFSKQTGLVSNNIYTIFESTPDSVWIGTENGATLWDGQDHCTNYTSADGLTGKRITAFFKDKNQQIWAFSDAYLHHWKNQKWHALKSLTFQKTPEGRVYDVAYDRAFHRVFVASTTGAFVLDLNKIQPMLSPIPLVIESIESKLGILDRSKINVLDADNNSIRIHFSLPSYTRTKANECYFRLLENGDTWHKAEQSSFFQFENLPAGTYTLQALSINPDGLASDIQTIAKFRVLAPLWLRWWAILLEIFLGIALIGGIIAWYFHRKNQKRLATLKIERELQTERERISRDLHDNIGAQLTNITYKLDLAAHQSHNQHDAQKMENISGETRNTMKLLRDTIWALQKDEFSIQDLALKTQNYIQRLEGIEVQFKVKINIEQDWKLSSKEILHLFRIGQEAIQNIIKHAEATEAIITFKVNQERYELQFVDDGKGFSPLTEEGSGHYGLENMNFRAKEVGADFSIEKHYPQGTCVRIRKQS